MKNPKLPIHAQIDYAACKAYTTSTFNPGRELMQAKDMTETLKSVSSRMIARYDMAIDAIVSNKTIPQADY